MSATASPRSARPAGTGAEALLRRIWRDEAPVLGAMLLPAELAFRLAQAAYHRAYDIGLFPATRAAVPVISVGNLAVGGAGKTPVARWLVDELLALGERPALLHGGYAEDEPELHRRWHPAVPVYAGRDRARSAALAAARGASVLVLDDGFQHRRLRRDLDIVLVAAERWTARPRLLPLGPWREPPAALGRAQAIVVTRKVASAATAEAVAHELPRHAPNAAVVRLALEPSGWCTWPGAPAAPTGAVDRQQGASGAALEAPAGIAVCAIADPELFLENARAAGGRIREAIVFRDHHGFTDADLRRIEKARRGERVLTTEKDAVRLATVAPRLPLAVLKQVVRVEAGGAALFELVARALARG